MAEPSSVPHKQRAHFPFVNLSKALNRAKQLYEADPVGRAMSVSSAFEVWGYSLKSSGGHQTVATLRQYGLLNAEGTLDARKLSLSSDAIRYFKDERPEEREKLLQMFALRPKLFNSLWRDSNWKASPPSDNVARSHLKIDKGLSEQAARAVLGIYKENLALANLKGDAKIQESANGVSDDEGAKDQEPPPPAVSIGDFIQWTSAGVEQLASPRRVEWVSDDRKYLRVFGSPTDIPMNEVTVAEGPGKHPTTPPPPSIGHGAGESGSAKSEDISVYLVRDRLQITADVDAEGLEKLKEILDKYTEILKLMA